MPFHPHRQYFIEQVLPMPHIFLLFGTYGADADLCALALGCPPLKLWENLLPQHYSIYILWKMETNTSTDSCVFLETVQPSLCFILRMVTHRRLRVL